MQDNVASMLISLLIMGGASNLYAGNKGSRQILFVEHIYGEHGETGHEVTIYNGSDSTWDALGTAFDRSLEKYTNLAEFCSHALRGYVRSNTLFQDVADQQTENPQPRWTKIATRTEDGTWDPIRENVPLHFVLDFTANPPVQLGSKARNSIELLQKKNKECYFQAASVSPRYVWNAEKHVMEQLPQTEEEKLYADIQKRLAQSSN